MRGHPRLALLALFLLSSPCCGYFWAPLRCYSLSWTARGSVCSGTFSGRTCARSQADIDAYVSTLEAELAGDMEACTADLQDRLPLCEHDDTQLGTPQVLSNLCCGRGSTCNSHADCERLETQSGYIPVSSTVLELGGQQVDFISVNQLDLSARSFSFAFWARRRQLASRMMVLHGNSPHTNLHVGFRENDAFVFSFTHVGWDEANGLQTPSAYTGDLDAWVHWAGTYDISSGARIIYRNGAAVASDTIAGGYQRAAEDLHISSTVYPFHGTLDDIYILTDILAPTEIAVLVREKQISMRESLLLWFNFEDPAVTNPLLGPAGMNVTDLSGLKNHGVLHGNWNRTNMYDSVPMTVTCPTSLHGPSAGMCLETLDYWERGVCVDTNGADIGAADEVKVAELTLPSGYTYPPLDRDPHLVSLKDMCTQACRANGTAAATACKLNAIFTVYSDCLSWMPSRYQTETGTSCAGELKVTASSAACYGHTRVDVDRASEVFVYGGQQYCWTADSILSDLHLPPISRMGSLRGPGGWTDGLSHLSPSCLPRYWDDRSYQCLFRSICGAAYDTLEP